MAGHTADKRKGIAFQNFVAQVERAFAANQSVEVVSPKYITDLDSDSRREFDVWIVASFGAGHEVITAVEVKDEATKIGVPEVEAFLSKCARNNINAKVMVSPKGANAAALRLAQKRNVRIMTMAQAEAFDWLAMTALKEHRRVFGPAEFHVELGEGVIVPEGPTELLDANGEVVGADDLAAALHRSLPQDKDEEASDHPKGVCITFTDEFKLRASGDRIYPVHRVFGLATYTTELNSIPLALHTYTGKGGGEGVNLSFATADLQIGGVGGKVVFARQADGSTDISWQPNPGEIPKAAPTRKPRRPRPAKEADE